MQHPNGEHGVHERKHKSEGRVAKFSVIKIRQRLSEEGIQVSRKSLYFLLKKYNQTCSVADLKRTPRKRLLTDKHFRFMDEAMEANPELTSRQLHGRELFRCVSISTVKRACKALGWSTKKTRYCALITEVNKEKRMTWCLDRIAGRDLQLSDVIWTDESSIQLESHWKITYQKKGHPVHLAGRPKHPPKIHVWGGISSRGATPIVMFTETLIATKYTRILDAALLPFIHQHYPDGHCFQQDSDPKHMSRWAQAYFEQEEINRWHTPASSPDLNPIENVWGSD